MKFFGLALRLQTLILGATLACTSVNAAPNWQLDFVTPHAVIGPNDWVDVEVTLHLDEDALFGKVGPVTSALLPPELATRYAPEQWKATYAGIGYSWGSGHGDASLVDPYVLQAYGEYFYDAGFHQTALDSQATIIRAGTHTAKFATFIPETRITEGTYQFGYFSMVEAYVFSNIATGKHAFATIEIARTNSILSRTISPVPEPSAAWMALLGGAGLVMRIRRQT